MDKNELNQRLSQCPYVYQPIFGLPKSEQPSSKRNGYDRLNIIKNTYQKLSSLEGRELKVLDLGCNAGFYSFELAEIGADVTGIELNYGFFQLCEYLKEVNGSKNVRFLNSNFVELYESRRLGEYDLVLGLSIFHHIASRNSFTKAREIVESLGKNSAILLELALCDEVGNRAEVGGPSWANSQPKNYKDWLINFNWKYELGRFKTPSSETSRPILFGSDKYILNHSTCFKVASPQTSSQIINIFSNTINIADVKK